MKLFKHQKETATFIEKNSRVMCTSDPGTGKTASVITGFKQRKAKKMLVLAPLSIMKPSWGDDITKFAPELKWGVAHGSRRNEVISGDYDIVITNHDAVKWLLKLDPAVFIEYDMICIDEFTVYKHHTSQRSKAVRQLIEHFPIRVILSGTPNSNSVTDIWHPTYLLDSGERLGHVFYKFRLQVCRPVQTGPSAKMMKWLDKPGAGEIVADMLRDITIRHKLEDCLDLPDIRTHYKYVELPKKLRKQYNELAYTSFLETQKGNINAIHAGARVKKLLQLLSGAVYDENGQVVDIHKERHELVMQLVSERKQSLVAFNWKHERDALVAIAEQQKIPYAVIDGDVGKTRREEAVEKFQNGELQVIFAHPQSAGHGLTLTAGSSTIWCSPTYNAEHFQQFNRRVYRAGQTKKTEIILIAAEDTKEIEVYEKLEGKLTRMEDLLSLFRDFTQLKKTG